MRTISRSASGAERSKIVFLSLSEEGSDGGLISCVTEHRPGHPMLLAPYKIGEKKVETFAGAEFDAMISALEIQETPGGPEDFTRPILIDIPETYFPNFDETWPAALRIIKQIAEKESPSRVPFSFNG